MISTRYNSCGVEYVIFGAVKEDRATIRVAGSTKQIIVHFNCHIIDQCWRDWTYGNKMIQDAFPMLSDSEREFLMSGLTPEEFDEMFKQREEEE